MIRLVVFDWGDTLMRDLPGQRGPMADWPVVEAVPGATAALAALQGRYRLALATNAADSGAEKVREALARVGLADPFEAILTARELGFAKPAPEFFRAVLERCDCAPAEAVMVGDSWRGDVEGARAAGLRAVWFNPARRPAPGDSADAIISDLGELAAALERLSQA